MESLSTSERLGIRAVQARLLALVRRNINNGEYSERALARLIGISQPQLHNLLKVARRLPPETADRLLEFLQMSVADLLTREELERAQVSYRMGQDTQKYILELEEAWDPSKKGLPQVAFPSPHREAC